MDIRILGIIIMVGIGIGITFLISYENDQAKQELKLLSNMDCKTLKTFIEDNVFQYYTEKAKDRYMLECMK